ncbi:aminotransferase class IV family protein [Ruminiclostridium herbifermentans]|uniref:Aminotransferase class IV family protein n=1 Tax=Ruminiclostridium herbifermentans TaxID=2488810 RepID=A0A4U7JHF1_9FIRM|nr:aminotransferase class IV [Ruminiclostridium herbifermentans]QNU66114.1 aminotransferase class IV family protein [Ruminiclostridium herbifermentans]
MISGFISINGQIKDDSVPVLTACDTSFLYGFGVFETLRIYNGVPFMLKEHVERMKNAASKLKIPFEHNYLKIRAYVQELIDHAQLKECVIRVTLSKVSEDSSNIIITYRKLNYEQSSYNKGFMLKCSSVKRNPTTPLVYLKTNNYMENIIEKNLAMSEGFNEALFLNIYNHVSECSTSNIFFVQDGKLCTPDVECGLLDGIARGMILCKLATEIGLEIEVGKYSLENLCSADEVFISNSVMQIMPVVKIDSTKIGDGIPGSITKSLMAAYDTYVDEFVREAKLKF